MICYWENDDFEAFCSYMVEVNNIGIKTLMQVFFEPHKYKKEYDKWREKVK